MTEFKVVEADKLQEGRLVPFEVDGELVCLTKVAGTIYAFTDNCTHISGPLSSGGIAGAVLTCPWHLAQFDVRTGKVLRGPARQDLMTYPVRVMENDVYIDLPDEA